MKEKTENVLQKKKLKIGTVELPSPVGLAPMAGVTDLPFRILCREQGCGLMVCGNVVLPFENRIPTDTQLYRMMTTKPGEMEAEEGRENG